MKKVWKLNIIRLWVISPASGEWNLFVTTGEQPQYVHDLISSWTSVYGFMSVTVRDEREVSYKKNALDFRKNSSHVGARFAAPDLPI